MLKLIYPNRAEWALRRELKNLPYQIGKRVEKDALKAGAAEILKEAKRRAPRSRRKHASDLGGFQAGLLRRSLAVSKGRRIRRYRGVLVAVVGPAWPWGAHGHLVEHGTRHRKTRAGHSRGSMPATPFLEPAFHAKIQAARRRIREKLATGIEREAAKIRAKAR
jgi:HK97 gp10 family phage protein